MSWLSSSSTPSTSPVPLGTYLSDATLFSWPMVGIAFHTHKYSSKPVPVCVCERLYPPDVQITGLECQEAKQMSHQFLLKKAQLHWIDQKGDPIKRHPSKSHNPIIQNKLNFIYNMMTMDITILLIQGYFLTKSMAPWSSVDWHLLKEWKELALNKLLALLLALPPVISVSALLTFQWAQFFESVSWGPFLSTSSHWFSQKASFNSGGWWCPWLMMVLLVVGFGRCCW